MRKALKTIRSHSGYARFLRELEQDNEGYARILREVPMPNDIPSPYHYGSTWPVYRWRGQEVFVRETAHKCYQVFALTDAEKAYREPTRQAV